MHCRVNWNPHANEYLTYKKYFKIYQFYNTVIIYCEETRCSKLFYLPHTNFYKTKCKRYLRFSLSYFVALCLFLTGLLLNLKAREGSSSKPGILSWISRRPRGRRELAQQVTLWPPHLYHGICAPIHIHKVNI